MITIIADEDVIDELACYPDKRCLWLTEPVDISDEEFEKYTDANDDGFWARVSDEMHHEVIRAYKEWKEEINDR
jgi:hypothetical protein